MLESESAVVSPKQTFVLEAKVSPGAGVPLQGAIHDNVATQPGAVTEGSELNTKVKDPSAAVEVIVPGDIVP